MINCGIGFSTRFCVKPCIFDAICPRRGLARSFVARAGPRWGSNPCLSFSFHLADAASSCYKPYVNLIITFSILKVTLTADAIWILYLPFGNVEMSTCRLKPRRLKSVKINGNFMNLWIPRPLAIVKSWKRRETIFRNMPWALETMAPILLVRLDGEVKMRPQTSKWCVMPINAALGHPQLGLEGPS